MIDTEGQFGFVTHWKWSTLFLMFSPIYLSPVDADSEQGEHVEGHRHVAHIVVDLAVH